MVVVKFRVSPSEATTALGHGSHFGWASLLIEVLPVTGRWGLGFRV